MRFFLSQKFTENKLKKNTNCSVRLVLVYKTNSKSENMGNCQLCWYPGYCWSAIMYVRAQEVIKHSWWRLRNTWIHNRPYQVPFVHSMPKTVTTPQKVYPSFFFSFLLSSVSVFSTRRSSPELAFETVIISLPCPFSGAKWIKVSVELSTKTAALLGNLQRIQKLFSSLVVNCCSLWDNFSQIHPH